MLIRVLIITAVENAESMRLCLIDQNLAELDPEPWVEILLYSHPKLSRRIAMAKDFSSD